MLLIPKLSVLWGGGSVSSISIFGTNTASAASITLPASINAGDFIILDQFTRNIGLPASVTPSGFTNIYDFNDGNNKSMLDVKIAVGNEGGTSVTGMDGINDYKTVTVVRGDKPIKSYTVNSQNTQSTSGNPTAQSCTAVNGPTPLIIMAHWASDGTVNPRTASPAMDAELSPNVNFYTGYKIYNSSPATHSIDMDDEGGNQLASLYFSFS